MQFNCGEEEWMGFADVSGVWSDDVWGASMPVRHIKWPNCPIPAPLIRSRGVEGGS